MTRRIRKTMKTKITELLQIEYPIFQGGMAWVAEHKLAAAVSNAGGLGIIGAASAPPEVVREEIRKCKELTDKPFGVNIMLLNHKDALDFVLNVPDYLKEISVHRIEDIHSLLTKDLGVERNIRRRRVGITGTNYRPLDNEFQIREALEDSCKLINGKDNIFEKSLLALVLLSYIQAFSDGNKRTARITSNAILIANGYCPISFRTVDSIDYKKAMLIFYEQNNIAAFKKIFIEQFEFAVKTYF